MFRSRTFLHAVPGMVASVWLATLLIFRLPSFGGVVAGARLERVEFQTILAMAGYKLIRVCGLLGG